MMTKDLFYFLPTSLSCRSLSLVAAVLSSFYRRPSRSSLPFSLLSLVAPSHLSLSSSLWSSRSLLCSPSYPDHRPPPLREYTSRVAARRPIPPPPPPLFEAAAIIRHPIGPQARRPSTAARLPAASPSWGNVRGQVRHLHQAGAGPALAAVACSEPQPAVLVDLPLAWCGRQRR